MSDNSFDSRATLSVDGTDYVIHRLNAVPGSERLPYSLKVLLENLLRTEDGVRVTREQIEAVAGWDPSAEHGREIQFSPARVLMQDFTGVPCVVDLVAMRNAMADLGGEVSAINPLIPTELVIDHSVIADSYALADSFQINTDLEFERNKERYELLRWAQGAFDDFTVVPPGTGICHQVNLEHLGRGVFTRETDEGVLAYPDSLVGTDSHTPMINGLGTLGWGVGGIEAEAAMLGQPMSMLVPQVVGLKLTGELQPGTTATDVVLTVAELLRQTGVVGKFVEFYGPGVAHVSLANRATLGNMSPEYGSTVSIFPIDEVTLDYLRLTGRPEWRVRLVEEYAKAQGMWHDPDHEPDFSQTVELDLSSVRPSIAGPKRPQDRIPVNVAKKAVGHLLAGEQAETVIEGVRQVGLDEAGAESFPASDPAAIVYDEPPRKLDLSGPVPDYSCSPTEVTLDDGTSFRIDNGHVVIAAITSCTNTSNPEVMLGAALLAQKAVDKGLRTKPWVKTTLAPGSKVVTDYIERAGLTPALDQLGFNLVGYGCTTCIGNSGPLPEPIAAAVREHDLNVASVLSGNRNFEGRVHGDVRMNFLASPPLVVAYALAGTIDTDLSREPLGQDKDGNDVYLKDIWPSQREIQAMIRSSLDADMFIAGYSDVFSGDRRWQELDVPEGEIYRWDTDSTYVRNPPYFDGMSTEVEDLQPISGARCLALLGDSITTDHISPAGAITKDSPAGKYLRERGVRPLEFNSYGSRRGNHEVMMRGTFANVRLRNQLAPGTEGGWTRHQPSGEEMSIYDAAMKYADEGTPLVVLAGAEYGTGSSRDWAAKGTLLLGVKAVIAASYERIHRSNLVGMGVLPLQFQDGDNAESLGLDGTETFAVDGLAVGTREVSVTATAEDGKKTEFQARVRIDTPKEWDYYQNGGILHYVLRNLAKAA